MNNDKIDNIVYKIRDSINDLTYECDRLEDIIDEEEGINKDDIYNLIKDIEYKLVHIKNNEDSKSDFIDYVKNHVLDTLKELIKE